MKRLLALLLCAVFVLTGCAHDDVKHISAVIYDELLPRFSGRTVSDYRVLAALTAGGGSLDGTTVLPIVPDDDSVTDNAEYLLVLYYAKKGGADMSQYDSAQSAKVVENAIADPDALSAYEVFVCTAALTSYGIQFDREAVVKSLEARQDAISGGFYEYVQSEGGGSAACEALPSAYAYMTYVMLMDVADGFHHDNALLYLGNRIENDNTIKNSAGKSSCSATAIVLTALLSSGIPHDGEISTALLTAIRGFMVGSRYADIKGDSPDSSTEADVLLCAASAIYGNPFTTK